MLNLNRALCFPPAPRCLEDRCFSTYRRRKDRKAWDNGPNLLGSCDALAFLDRGLGQEADRGALDVYLRFYLRALLLYPGGLPALAPFGPGKPFTEPTVAPALMKPQLYHK